MLYEIGKFKSDNLSNTETRFFTEVWNSETNSVEEITTEIISDSFPTYYAPPVEISPMTDEIKLKVLGYAQDQFRANFEIRKQAYRDLVIKLNDERLPQKIGQKVVILKGSHRGLIGDIVYTCDDKFGFKVSRSFMQDLILQLVHASKVAFPNQLKEIIGIQIGEKRIFVKAAKCQVLEGFVPYLIPADDVIKSEIKMNSSNWKNLFNEKKL